MVRTRCTSLLLAVRFIMLACTTQKGPLEIVSLMTPLESGSRCPSI